MDHINQMKEDKDRKRLINLAITVCEKYHTSKYLKHDYLEDHIERLQKFIVEKFGHEIR